MWTLSKNNSKWIGSRIQLYNAKSVDFIGCFFSSFSRFFLCVCVWLKPPKCLEKYHKNYFDIQMLSLKWVSPRDWSQRDRAVCVFYSLLYRLFESHRTIWVINFNVKAFKLNAISFYCFVLFFFLFLAFILLSLCTHNIKTNTHIPYRILSLSPLLIHRIYTQRIKIIRRETQWKFEWKKNLFYFYTFAHEMMGILVFELVENHVLKKKSRETSYSWPIFELHAHWITCACTYE